jgi:hypothetical protein
MQDLILEGIYYLVQTGVLPCKNDFGEGVLFKISISPEMQM